MQIRCYTYIFYIKLFCKNMITTEAKFCPAENELFFNELYS